MDFDRLGAELVRALRGARTQRALSRGLGYASNVLFAWESGRDAPSLRVFLRLLRHLGRSPEQWLRDFGKGEPPRELDRSEQALLGYLRSLRGSRTMSELAGQLGKSRYVVSRWLSGKTELTLGDFLAYVEVTTLASLDLVALLVSPHELPTAAAVYARLEAARRSAIERPWSHAIVHMVQLPAYQELCMHEPGWFASRLGITVTEEKECLELLLALGRLSFDGARYHCTETLAVDTRPDPDATRRLASFWMHQGADRVLSPGPGRFGFNTFGISALDYARLREMQSRYFAEMRALISESECTELVCVATFQLFPLSGEA